jgi:hypothetical protein
MAPPRCGTRAVDREVLNKTSSDRGLSCACRADLLPVISLGWIREGTLDDGDMKLGAREGWRRGIFSESERKLGERELEPRDETIIFDTGRMTGRGQWQFGMGICTSSYRSAEGEFSSIGSVTVGRDGTRGLVSRMRPC